MSIDELGLSDRARNALKRSGVHTVEQLLEMTPTEVCALRGIGARLFAEIADAMIAAEKKKTPGRSEARPGVPRERKEGCKEKYSGCTPIIAEDY